MNFALSQLVISVIFSRFALTEHHFEDIYPFLVKIEAEGKILDCAGTILTPCIVLTSAHCVEGVEPSQVIISQINATVTKYYVVSSVIHPKYNSTVLANDIALLEIEQKFREPWRAVILNSMAKEEVFSRCNSFQIVGWSMKMKHFVNNPIGFAEKPMTAPVKLISNENCSKVIRNFGGVFQGEGKLCGVPDDEGDEEECFTGPGGPLLCLLKSKNMWKRTPKTNAPFQQDLIERKEILAEPIDLLENLQKPQRKKVKREIKKEVGSVQVGVVSWGKSCSKVPSVYIKTDFYSDWIKETAKKMSKKCAPGFMSVMFWNPLPTVSRGKFTSFPDFTLLIISFITIVSLIF